MIVTPSKALNKRREMYVIENKLLLTSDKWSWLLTLIYSISAHVSRSLAHFSDDIIKHIHLNIRIADRSRDIYHTWRNNVTKEKQSNSFLTRINMKTFSLTNTVGLQDLNDKHHIMYLTPERESLKLVKFCWIMIRLKWPIDSQSICHFNTNFSPPQKIVLWIPFERQRNIPKLLLEIGC